MRKFLGDGYATAFFAVLAAWLALTAPWLSGQVTIPYDAKAHFQAQIQFLANALHSGQSPFWTHNVFAGSPQIADPQSLIFSPAFFLAYFEAVPSFRQLDAFVFGYLGFAGLAVLMFFRDRGWHPAGATVAAIALAFGASAAWRTQHIMQVQTLVFLAISLWLLARALSRNSTVYGLLAGLFIGFMIIGPGQVAMLGCYLLAGFVLHHWLSSTEPRQTFRASLQPLVLCGMTTALIAAAPVLLTFLFLESSNRPEVEFFEAGRGSLHPAFLLTALVPDLFGASNPDVAFWGPGSAVWPAQWLALSQNMGQIYIGALPILAVVLLGLRRGVLTAREIRFFTIATAILVVYALGRYTPIFELIYHTVPGVDFFRRPADATFLFGCMLGIVAGYAIHRYLSSAPAAAGLRTHLLHAFIIVTGLAASVGVAIYFERLDIAILPLVYGTAFILGATALLLASRRLNAVSVHLPVLLLAGFMVLDLAKNNGPNESTGLPPARYDVLLPDSTNTTLKFLRAKLQQPSRSARRDRIEMVGLGFEWPNASLVHNFDHVFGYNPLRLAQVDDTLGGADTLAEPRQRVFTPIFPSYRSLMADLLGLRYIASSVPINVIDKNIKPGDLALIARTPDAYIYENPRALPRAFFVADWREADFDALLKTGAWPQFDPRRTVLLDHRSDLPRPTLQDMQRAQLAKVRIRSYLNTVVEVEVDAATAGYVIFNDVWHPWWFATLNGQPADIMRANVLFRAVQVPKGRHLLRFEFRPIAGAIAQLGGGIFSTETAQTNAAGGPARITRQ